MGAPGSHRIYKSGGIQSRERVITPVNPVHRDDRMTFAEAIDLGGLDLRVAALNYLPSRAKDLTKDRLQVCVNAGLTQTEIARGFGTNQPNISAHIKRWHIKPGDPVQPTPEKKAWAKDAAAEIMARVVDELEPEEPTGNIEDDVLARKDMRKPGLIVNEDFEAEFVKIDAEQPESNEPEEKVNGVAEPSQLSESQWHELLGTNEPPEPAAIYTLVFSPPDKFAELVVDESGDVLIRNCEMDLQLRYVLQFKPDLTGLRVANDPKGFELRTKGNSFRFGCVAIRKAITAAGIELPARYRLDIEEMTGVLL